MEKSFSIPISRRSFMKMAGLTAAGAILGGTSDTPKAEAAAPPAPSADFSEAELPVLFDVDVCVVGGGAAGTAAAISAAQKGANVVLVERGVTLGGLATQGCVYPCMRTFAYDSDTPYITELNRRMEKRQGISPLFGIETDTSYGGGQGFYVPECLTWVYDEWCEEADVNVLYDTALVGAITEGGAITSCVVQTVEGLVVYGPKEQRDAVVSFNVGTIHHLDIGTLLDRLGIAVRTGHHCAQPLMDRLDISGTVRASFALYNTREEVDALVNGLRRVSQMF